jgi:hypothetical protein
MILPASVNHIQDSCLLILTKNINYSIRCQILHHIKMSDLVLKLAGDAKVRGTTTHDGMQVFSVYDFKPGVPEKWNVRSLRMGAIDI